MNFPSAFPFRKELPLSRSNPPLYPCLINHVILRSLNAQCLFHEEADREKFLGFLRESIKSHDLCVYAYALMEEHIHLLFKTPRDPSQSIYWLRKRYSLYFSRKYETGRRLFKPGCKAETVSDPLSLVCFILRDPVRRGLVSDPFASPMTSIGIFNGQDLPVCRDALLSLADLDTWLRLLSRPQPAAYMEYGSFPDPEEIRAIIHSVCSPEEKSSFHYLPPDRKNQILRELRSCSVTYSAIREHLGVSKYEIDLALGRIRKVPEDGGKTGYGENGCPEEEKK
jgi:REP element-mobilizing transposase RayT